MTSDPTASPETPPTAHDLPPRRTLGSRRLVAGAAIVAVLIVGVAAGAVATNYAGHSRGDLQVPLPPVAISAMTDSSIVAVKGQVAEIFGNKFIIQDASGRALIETGREGEDGKLVAKDEAVTVQGRFEHGFLHASFIVHGDGKTVQIDSPHGPGSHHHGPLDWLRHGHAAADSPVALPSSGT